MASLRIGSRTLIAVVSMALFAITVSTGSTSAQTSDAARQGGGYGYGMMGGGGGYGMMGGGFGPG